MRDRGGPHNGIRREERCMKIYQVHTFDEQHRLQFVSSIAYGKFEDAEAYRIKSQEEHPRSLGEWIYEVKELDLLP